MANPRCLAYTSNMAKNQRLTRQECWAKAQECREMVHRDSDAEHRVMLGHIAETWDRLAQRIKGNGKSEQR
jgi:hypothetical protein